MLCRRLVSVVSKKANPQNRTFNQLYQYVRYLSSDVIDPNPEVSAKYNSELIPTTQTELRPEGEASFATLLRESAFVQMGDPVGKVVTGEVFRVVGSDLYIDFGHKFHCVCTRPASYRKSVYPGDNVKLRIIDTELAKTFYGEYKAASLLEADCTLLSIDGIPVNSPVDSIRQTLTSRSSRQQRALDSSMRSSDLEQDEEEEL